MATTIDISSPASRFRLVAVLEAITWAGLLTAMFFKYALHNEAAMMAAGMTHGMVFLAYLLVTVTVARPLTWSTRTTLLALVASIPPFGSLVFERWVVRRGQPGELAVQVAR